MSSPADENRFFDRTGRWPFELNLSPGAQRATEEALRLYVAEARRLPQAIAMRPEVLLELLTIANEIRAHLQHDIAVKAYSGDLQRRMAQPTDEELLA